MSKLEPYAEYKNSGIEWLGMVPAEWTVVKTGHVTRLTTGWTPPTGDSDAYVGDNLWANISDLGPKILEDTSKRISDEAVASARIARSRKGSLLFSFKLSVGQVSFAGTDMYTNEAIATFEETDRLSTRFAYYALPIYLLQNANENIYGAKLLNQDLMKSARLCLPTKTIQDRIADYLDRETAQIDELISKQERLIELLAEKRQAIITQAVTRGLDPSAPTKPSGIPWLGDVNDSWPLRPLNAAGPINLGKMIQPGPKLETDFEAPYLRAANVQPNGALALDDVKNMWFKDRELQSLDVRSGDVVVVEGGIGGFGRAAYINRDLPGLGYQNSINRIRPSKSVDGRFLTYLLLTARHAGYMHAYCTGVSMPHLTAEKLAAIRVPLPDRTTQTSISDHIDARLAKLNALSDNASDVITILHERRSALISAAVTGRIDVREGAA